MEEFGLSEEQFDQVVSESHFEAITLCYSEKWRYLYTDLNMDLISVSNANRRHHHELDKRKAFFSEWKKKRGEEASYRKLVSALLNIDRRQDAEGVCRLLQEGFMEEESGNRPMDCSSSLSSSSSSSSSLSSG